MNVVSIVGRLTRDPELRYTQSGLATARFSVAVDRGLSREKKQEAQAKGQPTADFINVVAFGKTAELAGQYLAKGRQVAVQGRMQTGSYVAQDGSKRYTTDVVVDRLEFIGGVQQTNGPQPNDSFNQMPPQQNNSLQHNNEMNNSERDYGMEMDGLPLNDEDIPF